MRACVCFCSMSRDICIITAHSHQVMKLETLSEGCINPDAFPLLDLVRGRKSLILCVCTLASVCVCVFVCVDAFSAAKCAIKKIISSRCYQLPTNPY